MLRSVLRSFVFSRALVLLFAALGYFFLPSVHEGISVPLSESASWLTSIWYQWDANWYMSIVQGGYQWLPDDQSNVAFFPLYPLTVRALGVVMGGRYLLAGMLLSNLFMCGGMIFFYRLVRIDKGEVIARRAVWLLAIFPTSMFFTGFYTESLFLLTSVATFYYARQGRWATAGVWGLLASATRITGLWMVVPLMWEYLSQHGFSLRKLDASLLWLALVPAGLATFMFFLWLSFGSPFAFAQTQVTGWGHGFTSIWSSLTRDLGFLRDQSEHWVIYEFAATAILVAAIFAGLRKLRGSYNIYMLVSLLVPLFGGTTKSMSRYLVVIFPLFILMAIHTKKPWIRYSVYTVSILLLAVSTMFFVSGRWVA